MSENRIMRLVCFYVGLGWFFIGCVQWARVRPLSANFPGLAAIYCAAHFAQCSTEEDDE